MAKVLRSYGIPDKLADLVNKVIVSEEFDIVAGVIQGDTLSISPYLFIIVLDYALRKAINGHEEEL